MLLRVMMGVAVLGQHVVMLLKDDDKGVAATRYKCRMKQDIDILMAVSKRDFPMAMLTVRSIENFMPCYNTMHIVVDQEDLPKAFSWIGLKSTGGKLRYHPLKLSSDFNGIESYFLPNYLMMWADNFTYSTGAKYVMVMDSDSSLAMPVTCASLFDAEGRIFLMGWNFSTSEQERHERVCQRLIGDCDRSYSTNFPFIIPVHSSIMGEVRKHIAIRFDPRNEHQQPWNFDQVLSTIHWQTVNSSVEEQFFPFVVIGSYLQRYHPNMVSPIFCPLSKDLLLSHDQTCVNYVPVGIHYGYRPQYYLQVQHSSQWRARAYSDCRKGHFFDHYYNNRWTIGSIGFVESSTKHGLCLKKMFAGEGIPKHCDAGSLSTIHADVSLYGVEHQPAWPIVQKIFAPDDHNDVC